ncbi:MAG TPA: hypothetical protein VKS03_01600, partial [Thermoanaerobaculia bacterium]|nr:hypothetical protein [Thermoanaerobaculia bacterium]
ALALVILSLLVAHRSFPKIAMRLRDVQREPIARVLATAVAWEVARSASAGGSDRYFAALCLAAAVAAVPFLVLPFAHTVRSRA